MTYKSLGYSVIGMTNMPEAKLAREAEICYATVAMVTDFDCWHPDHDAVTVAQIIRVLTRQRRARQAPRRAAGARFSRASTSLARSAPTARSTSRSSPRRRRAIRALIAKLDAVAGRVLRQSLTMADLDTDLREAIRTIPDYPKPGIMFRDITTLLGNARAFRRAVDELVQPWAGMKIDKVAGIEARGFILGGAVAHQVSAGFVPIRKKGKLPPKRVSIAYALEYGVDEIEMHADALVAGERVVLVDDLIATGGTAEAAVKLLRQLGAEVLAACFVIDLPELGGAERLRKLGVPVRTLISFEGH